MLAGPSFNLSRGSAIASRQAAVFPVRHFGAVCGADLAARLILDVLLAEGLTGTCGCRAFYSPQEWKQRVEEYGHNSLLILVYDGGDITTCMDPAKGQHDLIDRFIKNLDQNGFVIEPCTHWYSAIYDENDYEPFAIGLG